MYAVALLAASFSATDLDTLIPVQPSDLIRFHAAGNNFALADAVDDWYIDAMPRVQAFAESLPAYRVEAYRVWIATLEAHREPWKHLYDAYWRHGSQYTLEDGTPAYDDYVREDLRELRRLIGWQRYYAGQMPPWIPPFRPI